MDQWFERLIDASAIATDESSLKMALSNFTKGLGFDRYAYLNLQAAASYAVSDYAEEWQERYFARSYSIIDPVVTTAKRRMVTFSWDDSSSGRRPSKELRRFYSEAADFGIRSGVSIPIRTAFGHMAMLTLATSAASASAQDIDPISAAAAVAQLHAGFGVHRSGLTHLKKVHLKPEELLCLRWAAEGKSMRMIAQIEGLSYGNVRFFVENAKSALGAVSLPQATAAAKALQLI